MLRPVAARGGPMTRAERLRMMAECHSKLADFLRAEAAEIDTPAAAPRRVRKAIPEPTATPRGIALARQALERHTRTGGNASKNR